mmetsp:Transcript_24280/g.91654  ORF Transcript_24280/g.91654 Transcript_24280/m.91654 type:complete len:220 (-) Transcript_24280:5262-5921(-)
MTCGRTRPPPRPTAPPARPRPQASTPRSRPTVLPPAAACGSPLTGSPLPTCAATATRRLASSPPTTSPSSRTTTAFSAFATTPRPTASAACRSSSRARWSCAAPSFPTRTSACAWAGRQSTPTTPTCPSWRAAGRARTTWQGRAAAKGPDPPATAPLSEASLASTGGGAAAPRPRPTLPDPSRAPRAPRAPASAPAAGGPPPLQQGPWRRATPPPCFPQ